MDAERRAKLSDSWLSELCEPLTRQEVLWLLDAADERERIALGRDRARGERDALVKSIFAVKEERDALQAEVERLRDLIREGAMLSPAAVHLGSAWGEWRDRAVEVLGDS